VANSSKRRNRRKSIQVKADEIPGAGASLMTCLAGPMCAYPDTRQERLP
jgi:hypothetical protein